MTHLCKHTTQAIDAGLEIVDVSVNMVRDTVLDIADDVETARERVIEVTRIAGNEAYEWTTDALADAKVARVWRNEKRFGYQPNGFDAKVSARLFHKRQKKQKNGNP